MFSEPIPGNKDDPWDGYRPMVRSGRPQDQVILYGPASGKARYVPTVIGATAANFPLWLDLCVLLGFFAGMLTLKAALFRKL